MNTQEMALPEAMRVETIEMLEEASALVFRALRQSAQQLQARDAGVVEYDSWSPRPAGAIEYDSWAARA